MHRSMKAMLRQDKETLRFEQVALRLPAMCKSSESARSFEQAARRWSLFEMHVAAGDDA
jgi:hypothetical protein